MTLNRLGFINTAGVATVSHVLRGETLRFEGENPQIYSYASLGQSIGCPVETDTNLAVVTASLLYMSGVVSGAGGLEFDAPSYSSAYLNPPSANLYQGPTTVKGCLTLITGEGRIAIPGALRMDAGTLYLMADSIATNSAVTFVNGGWINVIGPNRVGSIQFAGAGGGAIHVGADLTITGAGETLYSGGLSVSASLVKEQPAPLRLSGDVSGSGRIAANVVLTGRILGGGDHPDTLDFEGDLTLGDGAALELDIGADTNTPLIAMRTGSFQVTAAAGVVVNLRDSGTFGAGRWVLLDWSEAAHAVASASDFHLGSSIAGYTNVLSVVDNRLVLDAFGPPRNLRIRDVGRDGGTGRLALGGLVPTRSYRVDRASDLLAGAWDSIGSFPGAESGELVLENLDEGSFDKTFYRIVVLP